MTTLPYISRFQSGYRYPIAIAQPPTAGSGYWPGPLPPIVHSTSPPKKEVRFALHRSQTMPSQTQGPVATSSKPLKSAMGTRSGTTTGIAVTYASHPAAVAPTSSRERRASFSSTPVDIVPALSYSTRTVGLSFNVAYSPSLARLSGSRYALSDDDRRRPATTVPVPSIRISITGFPWPIEVVEASPRRGVRVGDVVDALSRAMYRRVRSDEYATLDSRTRDHINAAFHARVARAGERRAAVKSEGLIRLDWLQGRTAFRGLARTTDANTYALVLDYPV